MKRRTVLAGAITAPLVLGLHSEVLAAAMPRLPALTLYDARLRPADRAARLIAMRGGLARQTGGEIVRQLRAGALAQPGAVLGITGHAEMLLAADIARLAGRRLRPLKQTGPRQQWLGEEADQPWRPLLADLLPDDAQARAQATAFAWVVAENLR